MPPKLTRSQHHDLYYYLRLNRRVDEQLAALYRQGKVIGGVYLGTGQEAISVGSAYALEPEDVVGPMIRNAGALFMRGYRPRDLFMHYMGRRDSPTRGRDTATLLGNLERGVISPISMLGTLVPVMAGVGIAAQIRKEKRVALTWIGDGGVSTAPFHEGMNLAAVRKLPVIVMVENNQWAYSTPLDKQTAVPEFVERAKAYGVAGIRVDGNDVLKVYEATRAARDRARRGGGPTLIECLTMRMKGHAEHDDARYVPREMVEKWRKRDPILLYEKFLVGKKLMSAQEKSAIEARIEKEIREDVAAAEASPLPEPEETVRGVWANGRQ
jgi:TPP-dependent pyruvate/acetoin dehydrogenase alpha subunit